MKIKNCVVIGTNDGAEPHIIIGKSSTAWDLPISAPAYDRVVDSVAREIPQEVRDNFNDEYSETTIHKVLHLHTVNLSPAVPVTAFTMYQLSANGHCYRPGELVDQLIKMKYDPMNGQIKLGLDLSDLIEIFSLEPNESCQVMSALGVVRVMRVR